MHRRTVLIGATLLIAPMTVLSTAAPASAESVEDSFGVATEMIVWLEPGADAADVARDHDVVLLHSLVASKGIHLYGSDLELDEGKIKKVFDKDERVRYAEPNYEGVSADGNRFHAWPRGSYRHGASGQSISPTDLQADIEALHTRATGAGVTIALLDTGVDADHAALVGHVDQGWDLIDDDADADDVAAGLDADGDSQIDEAWGHGTHLAGIMMQIAPDARVLSYRVLDSDGTGRAYAVAAAIFDAVDRGADVINLSFGVDHKSTSKMLKDAMKYAKEAEVIVVAAAGNDGDDEKRYPAASSDVISVGALDQNANRLATFANYGWVEVAAPGVDVMSTLPGDFVGSWSGSSMAAPFVSAQAALLLDAFDEEKPKKIAEAIRKSSRKLERGNKIKDGAVDIAASFAELD